jgi:L-seryl-tRNA(Ser) seleniumtransferase
VEKVLQALGDVGLPRRVTVAVVRDELAKLRKSEETPDAAKVLDQIRAAVKARIAGRLQPLINATGVLLHTNLGRAPLGQQVVEAIATIGSQYSNLEFDLLKGGRGSRAHYVETSLAVLCQAEAATVVNNCAAALVLILRHFTRERKEVIISRGELVQIGGGFRIPEILEASGARLREVGTTNRTSLADYGRAIGKQTGLILSVHRSNFFMEGFVEETGISELATLARSKRVPLVHDLGSGAMQSVQPWSSGTHEPTPAESLGKGVDLVCFSGDKLMGGPQAGLIAGRARWIKQLKADPFFRALRCDKLILAGVQATVDAYLDGQETGAVPVLGMLNTPMEALRARLETILSLLKDVPATVTIGEGRGQLGGGTLPKVELPSLTLDIAPRSMAVMELAARLRAGQPAVIGYVSGGRLKLDLQTVLPFQDQALVASVQKALA